MTQTVRSYAQCLTCNTGRQQNPGKSPENKIYLSLFFHPFSLFLYLLCESALLAAEAFGLCSYLITFDQKNYWDLLDQIVYSSFLCSLHLLHLLKSSALASSSFNFTHTGFPLGCLSPCIVAPAHFSLSLLLSPQSFLTFGCILFFCIHTYMSTGTCWRRDKEIQSREREAEKVTNELDITQNKGQEMEYSHIHISSVKWEE